jgi:hypothetical protein
VSVDDRLARWAQRDAAIGLDAELTEVRAALAARDAEIADLRQRNEQLAQRVAQLATERDLLSRQVGTSHRRPLWRWAYLRARAVAGKVLRALES